MATIVRRYGFADHVFVDSDPVVDGVITRALTVYYLSIDGAPAVAVSFQRVNNTYVVTLL